MDAIQSRRDKYLKRNMQEANDALLKQQVLSEATYPLLISYFAWIRKINSAQNKTDVMNQNKQILNKSNYLCGHNLLFFLTALRQFNTIEKLFNTPPFAKKARRICALRRQKRRVAKYKKKKLRSLLKIKLTLDHEEMQFLDTVRHRLKRVRDTLAKKLESIGYIISTNHPKRALEGPKKSQSNQIKMKYHHTLRFFSKEECNQHQKTITKVAKSIHVIKKDDFHILNIIALTEDLIKTSDPKGGGNANPYLVKSLYDKIHELESSYEELNETATELSVRLGTLEMNLVSDSKTKTRSL